MNLKFLLGLFLFSFSLFSGNIELMEQNFAFQSYMGLALIIKIG